MIYIRVQMKCRYFHGRSSSPIRGFIAYRVWVSAMQAVGFRHFESWGFFPDEKIYEASRDVFYITISGYDDYHKEIGYFISRSMGYAPIKSIYVQKSGHIEKYLRNFSEFYIGKKIRYIEFELKDRDSYYWSNKRYVMSFFWVFCSGDVVDQFFIGQRK